MCADIALLLQWRSPALDVAVSLQVHGLHTGLGSKTQLLDFVLPEGWNPLSAN